MMDARDCSWTPPELTEWTQDATPDYYRLCVHGEYIDVFDIAMAANLTPPMATALKYIIRAGKKDDAYSDAQKAIQCINRYVELYADYLQTERPRKEEDYE